ncbi:MAG TPA: ABC transporter permease subunit [Thermomicrobiales bacterium]|nr:ABC transporter permease subunit [Thermomicrobiales bacterium]
MSTTLLKPAAATAPRRITATKQPNTLAVYARHLLGRYRRAGLFWAIGFSVYTALLVLSFPAFQNSGALDVSTYPESLREAFNLESLNLIEPYLSSQVFQLAPLVLAFYPITVFAGAIAGAEERGTLDVLLGNPLPRRNVVLGTWIAVALVMLGMLAILGAATWASALAVDVSLSAREAFRASLNLFPICMAFGSLALLMSAVVRQRAVAIGVPVVVLFLMYLIDIVGKIVSEAAGLRYASAFKYYGDAIVEGVWWGGVAVLLAVALVLLAAAIPAFDRRDIYT